MPTQPPRPRPRAGDDRETTALAFAARRGETNAMEEFVRATRDDVWRLVCHLTDVDTADDLTQETYVRALRALNRFAGRAHARTWLLAIARRVVVDHYRNRAARPATAGADWQRRLDQRPRHAVPRFEEELALLGLLEELSSDRRAAFRLTQLEGLSYREVAALTNCPVGTVRSRVARARRDLVAALRPATAEHGVAPPGVAPRGHTRRTAPTSE